ncbi:prion-inhibition and propagation-domain-containing protein [Hypoxylon trugodes]|uniref:prion-inhibition and propagation-domain-containing protein n=1 Tax=Hypoxylon trugodes TaxID=326681 RepID=UPI00219A0953|nr:prion-inhibition and propagation-domain-containing protein [Hypoxylon trugodes]KAI1387227.1 prion-inhibition and propagation-domain-containing protein [Hypoxylon trugodes]
MDATNTAISLFQFALSTFGRIQLAREFREDFEAHQLKLDIIQLRLSRWGEVVDITTLDTRCPSANELESAGREPKYDLASIKQTLSDVRDLCNKACRQASRIGKGLDAKTQEITPESCVPSDLEKLRFWLKECLRKRRAQASRTVQGVKWAFYKKENFENFIANLTALIDALEKIMPEVDREKLRQLSEEESNGIDKSDTEELKDVIQGCDPWLERSLDTKLNAGGAGTIINQSRNTGSTVGIHRGNNYGVSNGTNSSQTNTFKP